MRTLDGHHGKRFICLLGTAAIALTLGVAVPGTVAAAETHVFDATMSLTGDCSSNSSEPLDPIPDPGCPGGTHPPSGKFSGPSPTVDRDGNIYVVSRGPQGVGGGEARIDVFDSSGHFVTAIPAPRASHAVVDSDGALYVSFSSAPGEQAEVKRYDPTFYEPAMGEIAYGETPTVVLTQADGLFNINGMAINPANDHLFVNLGGRIAEYTSAVEGNVLVDGSIGQGQEGEFPGLNSSHWIAIDAVAGRIYASDAGVGLVESKVRVFDLSPPHKLLLTINGSTTPAKKFFTTSGEISVAAEESTGHLFVGDLEAGRPRVYEFRADGEWEATIEHGFKYSFPSSIAVDNGPASPKRGYLYVPTGESQCCHVYAFGPKSTDEPPVVEAPEIGEVTRTDAAFSARIVPNAPGTQYFVEYISEERFLESGFGEAVVAGEGELPNSEEEQTVAGAITGLVAGTAYRVRVRATNSAGGDFAEASFATFSLPSLSVPCANDGLRVGSSAGLPDCRAYELVSPADTGGHPPLAIGRQQAGPLMGTPSAASSGESVLFLINGGLIPGTSGAGAFNGDSYVARRGGVGWETESFGPDGSQSGNPFPGGTSSDHRAGFVRAVPPGPLSIEGKTTDYLRRPDGRFELLGEGSIGTALETNPTFITEGGEHAIFTTAPPPLTQLEPNAPPNTVAIYDRRPDGSLAVVSLLPGEVTPASGENVAFEGASEDAAVIAFKIPSTGRLYVRVDGSETKEVAAAATAAGVSADGSYVFYTSGGNLFRFDVAAVSSDQVTNSDDATVVNVPTGGGSVYFVSQSIQAPNLVNPQGVEPAVGEENLYLWREGSLSFVGTVTARDVEGVLSGEGGKVTEGLGLWQESVSTGQTPSAPSISTPDGTALAFESRANLTDYDAEGTTQLYRYDVAAGSLRCVSCLPTRVSPEGSSSLRDTAVTGLGVPVGTWALMQNLSLDGQRLLFQSRQALVPEDTDGLQDVYEWEAPGKGSCADPQGCVFLISSGQSSRPDYLFGVSEDGRDAIIWTADRLLPADTDGTPSLYDARVGGGFMESKTTACVGEACRADLAPPPPPLGPVSNATGPSGNVKGPRKCPKGKQKVKKSGKTRCVKKHQPKRSKRHHGDERTGR